MKWMEMKECEEISWKSMDWIKFNPPPATLFFLRLKGDEEKIFPFRFFTLSHRDSTDSTEKKIFHSKSMDVCLNDFPSSRSNFFYISYNVNIMLRYLFSLFTLCLRKFSKHFQLMHANFRKVWKISSIFYKHKMTLGDDLKIFQFFSSYF